VELRGQRARAAMTEETLDLEVNYLKCCLEPHDMTVFMPVLRAYARECATIAELGVRKGMSTIALLAGLPAGGKMQSFDQDLCENAEALEAMAEGVGTRWIFQQCDIYDLHPWPLKPDLLFLDFNHTYKGVTTQLVEFGSTARRWIIVHDTVSFPDVRVAIADWLAEAEQRWEIEREYCEGEGLVVLRREHGRDAGKRENPR